jgi:MFS family permease
MDTARKNVGVLAICQGLLLVNNSVLITVNALAGYALATDKALATLPVTAYFVGSALTTLPLSFYMKRYGRRAGFTLGACFAIAGSLLCAIAVYTANFWLLCAGVLVFGAYFAAGQYYRFAAADSAPADFRATAVSLVLAGGLVGGFIGPETSKLTKDIIAGHAYAGAYFSLILFALMSMVALRWLDIPPLTEAERKEPGRPLAVIARQPAFIVALLCAMVGYGVMNLIMTATPLAMVACNHPFGEAAFVIQWHLIGMFAPSFFTGVLIRRVGVLNVLLAGAALMFVCVAIAMSGVTLMHFWWALTLLGVGWNFLYIGGTLLLTEAHSPAEKAKVQGINDSLVFVVMVGSSLASGVVVTGSGGWAMLTRLTVPFLAVTALATSILWIREHRSLARG